MINQLIFVILLRLQLFVKTMPEKSESFYYSALNFVIYRIVSFLKL